MIKRRSLLLTFLVFQCIFLYPLYSRNSGPLTDSELFVKFEHISAAQGLSQSSILCILQDHKGFMWFGSYGGLNRYDGYRFEVYKTEPGDTSSLSHNIVTAICEEKTETGPVLWVGTEGGLNKFDLETERFTQYKSDPNNSHSLSHDRIKSLFIDSKGTLWVGTDGGGLNKYVKEKDGFDCFLHHPEKSTRISNNHIRCIYEDAADNGNILWVGTDLGLNKFDRQTNTFQCYAHDPHNPDSLSTNNITTVAGDRRGYLWVGTWKGGLNRFDRKTGKFTRYRHDPSNPAGPGHNIIRSIYEDHSGDLWIGTFGGGLDKFDRGSETFIHFRNNPMNPHSLGSNRIWSIYEDRAGVLWIGTDFGGIDKFDKEKKQFFLFKADPGMPGGLNNNNITALYEPPEAAGKLLWIGTSGGGLKKFDRQTNRYTHYMNEPGNPNSLSSDTIRTLFADPGDKEKILWVGTDGGLNKFDTETERFTRYQAETGNPDSLSYDNVYSICKDSSGKLWIGTFYGGLNLFDPVTERFKRFRKDPENPNALNDDIVWAILEDSAGIVWIGTDRGGLNRYHRETGEFSHYTTDPANPGDLESNKILALHEDRAGMLWLGTPNGLTKFDPREQRFTSYGPRDILPNNSIQSLMGDEKGNLWLGTLKGLLKFDPRSGTFEDYNMSDGLQGNEFNVNACFRSPTGEMFFGGIEGFNAFFPGDIKENLYVPPIVFTGFQVFNRPVPIGEPRLPGDRWVLEKSVTYSESICLLYKENVFSLEFAALHYASPGENEYAYIMEGFEQEWNHVGNRRFATYTNLPPGDYTFRVKGTNSDGIWNDEGTSLKIIIVPPFWKTWWFYTLAAVFIIVLAVVIEKFSVKFLFLFAFWKKQKYVGQYKLIEKIGGGGMGTVFKAHYIRDDSKTVAIKILKEELFADERSKNRFKQEASIIDQLDHPNILKIFERGEMQQSLYIVMEFLHGKTLEERIKEGDLVDLKAGLDIMIQISGALDRIHRQEIIHRDLKAENIMLVEKDGDPNFVKILDFGLARTKFQARLTETGVLVGTVGYLAPEQIARAEFSPAGDIHSMGIIFYGILTGKAAFEGDTATEIMRKILEQVPEEPRGIRPDVPGVLNDLIMRMLSKDPAQRPTAGKVLETLKEIGGFPEEWG